MTYLSQQEQTAFFIGICIFLITIIEILILPTNYNLKWFFVGCSIVGISVLMIFVFVFQPALNKQKGWKSYSKVSTSYSSNFRPTVIRPSGRAKKMISEGFCHFCDKSALMGFSCSYCNGYFCTEHRLPEKHECLGLRNL